MIAASIRVSLQPAPEWVNLRRREAAPVAAGIQMMILTDWPSVAVDAGSCRRTANLRIWWSPGNGANGLLRNVKR
jgi:hypothetical protein